MHPTFKSTSDRAVRPYKSVPPVANVQQLATIERPIVRCLLDDDDDVLARLIIRHSKKCGHVHQKRGELGAPILVVLLAKGHDECNDRRRLS